LVEMPELILFIKSGCEKCDYVKERIPDGLDLDFIDISTAEGMAEAAFYELMDKPAPVLLVNEEPIFGGTDILSRLKELSDK
jgi:glutaredoxin